MKLIENLLNNMSRIFLEISEVIYIHERSLIKYGGLSGVRSMPSLESAVYRVHNGYYPDIIDEASAYLGSIIMNHPFLDGNKRTALGTLDIFIRINNHRLRVTPNTLYHHIIELLDNKQFNMDHIRPILHDWIKPAKQITVPE